MKKKLSNLALAGIMTCVSHTVFADDGGLPGTDCSNLPGWSTLQSALSSAQQHANGGFGLNMWATIVNRDGYVCGVAYTGADRNEQWPGSRIISAQKANTANAFSLPTLALSTANLYSAVQPGGSLYGLQHSNPVDPTVAYAGPVTNYGLSSDPLVGQRVGGVNVFGGGLALYNSSKELVGAIGVSGDSSCADHNIAWRTRNLLSLDYVPGGVSSQSGHPDNIVFDIINETGMQTGVSLSGWGHPYCSNNTVSETNELNISKNLPKTH